MIDLHHELEQSFEQLVSVIPKIDRDKPIVDWTCGKVSVAEVIAYLIGWGKALIRWYESGLREENPQMPGEGFSKWDYNAIAKHFYQTYLYDRSIKQMVVFEKVVTRILEIIDLEEARGNLHRVGVWSWCSLASAKEWPLSKWIQVNTIAPYKRTIRSIKAAYKAEEQ